MGDAQATASDAVPAGDEARQEGRIDLARQPEFALGPLRFAPATRQLFTNGDAETLEPRVMQVVALLAARRGEVVSRDELIECCWGGRIVGDDAINRSIAKVRKIGESHKGFALETIPRVGYRLKELHGLPDAPSRRLRIWTVVAALLALAVVGAALWVIVLRPGPAEVEPISIAVLPFRNLSPGDNYFAEGVAEEVLTQLARQPGLRVAGRTSSWLLRDNSNPRVIGRSLDVSYVLEGSVRRSGQEVRVDVALVDTRDGMRRWSETFEGSLDDIFAIQTQIGNAVAGNLRREIVLTAPAPEMLTTSSEVHAIYLTARALIRERTPAKLDAAADLLRRATELDPNYARAWSSLAQAIHMRNFYGGAGHSAASLAEEMRYVNRALTLAPNLAEAHASMALIRDLDRTTLSHLERAIRLDPNNPETWYWLYIVRTAYLDYEGALRAIRRSAAIDPFFHLLNWYYPYLAWSMGEREEAMRFWRRQATRHPDNYARLLNRFSWSLFHNDYSTAYRFAHQATESASPDLVEFARMREAALLFRLGLIDEALQLVRPPPLFVSSIRGEAPPMPTLRASFDLADFWSLDETRLMLPRLLLNAGRGRDLVEMYDSAFRSAEDMAERHPGGREAFVADVPNLAIALREVNRSAEADRLLALASRLIDGARRRGRTPLHFRANSAAVWAVQGRTSAALAELQQVIAAGWRWHGELSSSPQSQQPPLASQPAFRSLHSDPRLQRWDAMMMAEIARERREVEPLI